MGFFQLLTPASKNRESMRQVIILEEIRAWMGLSHFYWRKKLPPCVLGVGFKRFSRSEKPFDWWPEVE